MDIVDYINKYLKEQPQDEMIFEEIAQRAELSPAEMKVLWQAIERYCAVILDFRMTEFFDKLKENKYAHYN